MKRLLFIFILIIALSCSGEDDDHDCLGQRMEIMERYEALIEAEQGNQQQIDILIRNRNLELEALDC